MENEIREDIEGDCNGELILFRWALSRPLAPPDDESSGYSYKVRSGRLATNKIKNMN